ncbi:hypothetical protein WHR41_08101 [Cladosporium halotolerans]|uniref:C4-dicarboxylate transporter/malic acid transport protein n=1 Tax=Cladosporium halotolerans TaxID=1052096 RepID=A0AB34KJQ8_9PEZI
MDTQHDTRSLPSVVVENFSFLWFTVLMDTGILSIIMHQNPYQFAGLGILSTIMFVFNLVLFILFTLILLVRIFLFPKRMAKDMTTNLVELSMTGTVPIAYFTLVAQVSLTVSQAGWGSHAFTLVAFVMWWIGTAVALAIAVFVFFMVAKYSVTSIADLAPALVIPYVSMCTNALVGGLISSYSAEISDRLAVPVIIVSYILLGVGLFVALLVFAACTIRFIDSGLPPPIQYPTLFLLVGPVGQAAGAALSLGTASRMHFGGYGKGTLLQQMGGSTFSSIGVWVALLLLGLAVFFTLFALSAMIEGAINRQHTFSMLWWGTIFPVATVNTAWILLSTSLDSPAFRALSSIFLLALLIVYFANWGFTIYHLATGRVLGGVAFYRASADEMLEDGRKTE